MFVFLQIQLPKESNSVSSQAKMMLSLHVCIKNVEFYKYKIVFFAIKLIFMFAPSVQCSKKIILFLHKTRKSCLFMCLLNVFNLTNIILHLLQSNCFRFICLAPYVQYKVALVAKELHSIHVFGSFDTVAQTE